MTQVYEFAKPILEMLQAMGFVEVGYLPNHYWFEEQTWGLHEMSLERSAWLSHRERFLDVIQVQSRFNELLVSRLTNGKI